VRLPYSKGYLWMGGKAVESKLAWLVGNETLADAILLRQPLSEQGMVQTSNSALHQLLQQKPVWQLSCWP
jgi:hypothetical protein